MCRVATEQNRDHDRSLSCCETRTVWGDALLWRPDRPDFGQPRIPTYPETEFGLRSRGALVMKQLLTGLGAVAFLSIPTMAPAQTPAP